MPKQFPFYLLLASLLILSLSIGFFLGRTLAPDQNNSEDQTLNDTPNSQDALYSSQTAAIRGEITKVDDKVLTIKNLTNGETGTRQVSSRIIISKPGNKTPSNKLSFIELNKEALISLEKAGSTYQVTQIQFILPAPSLPPIASPSL